MRIQTQNNIVVFFAFCKLVKSTQPESNYTLWTYTFKNVNMIKAEPSSEARATT